MPPTRLLRAALLGVAGVAPLVLIDDPTKARTLALVALAVTAWLLEIVPSFVPTVGLLALAPLLLDDLPLRTVLEWSADPLLALFFGGFALGAAATATGLDRRMAGVIVRASRGTSRGLVAATAAGGFVTSMWMSNAAAAAVLIAALRPLIRGTTPLKTPLLLAIAMGTNFGGMVTPIGSGPNAIAIASLGPGHSISFIQWMALGLPLALALVVAASLAIVRGYRVQGPIDALPPEDDRLDHRQRALLVVFGCAVAAWLSEPFHGISSASVALMVAGTLFASGILQTKDLSLIDWATLLLIAGGLIVGRLLERSGALSGLAEILPLSDLPAALRMILVVGIAALLSALMSNTATALVLIPVVAALDPSPATPVLIAMGCALGVPFAISTPPNAMVVGAGASSRDLLRIGLPLMIAGTVFVALTGPWVLGVFGWK